MTLQSQNLVMIGLGIRDDTPPNSIQPPLVNGIHLRWAFKRELGFPWYGFYLFRRLHREGRPVCLSSAMTSLSEGMWPDRRMSTPYGQIISNENLLLTDDFAPPGIVEFDLESRRYCYIRLNECVRRIEVHIGFREKAKVDVSAQCWNVPVVQTMVQGGPGDIVATILEFDAITGIKIGSAPAALIDLCFVPVSQDAMVGWEPVPGFPYPMSLPVIQPDYPCNTEAEELSRARGLARDRILYGNPDELIYPPAPIYTTGTISVSVGTPIVKGYGTNWDAQLVGAVLQVNGDLTAYTIMQVISSAKLVISRAYVGTSRTRVAYVIRQDAFGQLHDQLVHLVAGGRAAGSMADRSIPLPIHAIGKVNVENGSKIVTGIGTNWNGNLTGLALHVVGATAGTTISVTHGQHKVTGSGTNWGDELVGMSLQVVGDRTIYTISRIDSITQLSLDKAYGGASGSGKSYAIFEKTMYAISSVVSPIRLTLDRAYIGTTRTGIDYIIFSPLKSPEIGKDTPQMPNQHPLDLVLVGALHPAVAQMLGLYWVDQRIDPDKAYDYLIIADHGGDFLKWDVQKILRSLDQIDLNVIDGYLVFNKMMTPASPLEPPSDLRTYALPGSTVHIVGGVIVDAQNNAGLCWDLNVISRALLPGKPVMYHLWRADLGELGNGGPQTTLPSEWHKLITANYDGDRMTKERPIVIVKPLDPEQQRASDWPPFSMQAIDRGLPTGWYSEEMNRTEPGIMKLHVVPGLKDGWYSYQVSGIDIFGRHSVNSAPAQWYQWEPVPDPRPWYYQDPPVDPTINQYAVRLLDKVPPPPPTGIEAFALDPDDPFLLKDEAYDQWRDVVGLDEIGLRVRWQWTWAHMQHAPDTREFRIYCHPGHMNTLLGRTVNVSPISIMESVVEVEVDSDHPHPARVYVGAWLRVRSSAFKVIGDESDSPMCLRVNNIGLHHKVGKISIENGSAAVTGTDTSWTENLTGMILHVDGDGSEEVYLIAKVNSPTHLTLDREYAGSAGREKVYEIYKIPRTGTPCTLEMPSPYTAGRVSLDTSSRAVTGNGTGWSTELVGQVFKVVGESSVYRIERVDSETQLTLDRGYEGTSGTEKAYIIMHPLFVDYGLATNWSERVYVVGYDEHVLETIPAWRAKDGELLKGRDARVIGAVVTVEAAPNLSDVPLEEVRLWLGNDTTRPDKAYRILNINEEAKTVTVNTTDGFPRLNGSPSPWVIGPPVPLRQYEVFLPAPHVGDGESFAPSPADPIVYAHIGVSAADDKTHTLDNPKWGGGGWGSRYGNEGRVGPVAKVFRVHRERPNPPVPPPDAEKVYATPADYHGHSFYTYRWLPEAYLKTHIFRALDDAVFKMDWSQRPCEALGASQRQFFPDATTEPRWDELKRQQVADELNQLNDFSHDTAGASQAMDYYHRLSNDAMRVLAGLPGSERAFSQITIQPLDPNDPANANRVGPDNPHNLSVDAALRAYVDTLDGRSTNRYFYRAAYVDGAHNRSELSLSSPPVYLPNVVPPRAPVITKVLGDDRKIILRWASNREPDLKEYRVYRADSKEAARDLRLMRLVHTKPVPPDIAPMGRPAEEEWVDDPVPGLVTFYYRVVAVDEADNVSLPSRSVTAQAYDYSEPEPPIWHRAEWVKLDGLGNEHAWNEEVENYKPAVVLEWSVGQPGIKCLVQRRREDSDIWMPISQWLHPGERSQDGTRWCWRFYNKTVKEDESYLFRLKLVNAAGKATFSEELRPTVR